MIRGMMVGRRECGMIGSLVGRFGGVGGVGGDV